MTVQLMPYTQGQQITAGMSGSNITVVRTNVQVSTNYRLMHSHLAE